MKYSTIRQRAKQRKRLAKTIKDIRSIKENLKPEVYKENIYCLCLVASNYPKLKQRGI
jgi:hypothetical protein